jgi:hypothetical protein
MNEVERRVNGKFRLVRFSMFSPQLNGGEKPDCIMTGPDGARFIDTNSAGKVAIGLDIIRTLQEFYGVSAPVWLDNRESVSEIPEIDCQIINLTVDPSHGNLVIKQ